MKLAHDDLTPKNRISDYTISYIPGEINQSSYSFAESVRMASVSWFVLAADGQIWVNISESMSNIMAGELRLKDALTLHQ
jgi:hypothetical protein